jgi:hypothetical protein
MTSENLQHAVFIYLREPIGVWEFAFLKNT